MLLNPVFDRLPFGIKVTFISLKGSAVPLLKKYYLQSSAFMFQLNATKVVFD
jgi:hypothetical protein